MHRAAHTTRAAWLVCGTSLVLLAVALWFLALGWSAPVPAGYVPWSGQVVSVLGAVGAPILGVLVAGRRPANRYGWLWLGFGLALALSLSARAYASYAAAGGAPGHGVAGVVANLGWVLWLASMPFLLLLYPTGSLPSRRWRWAARVAGLGGSLLLVCGTFGPELGVIPVDNPLSAPTEAAAVLSVLTDVGVYILFVSVIAGAVSLVFRYRAAEETERRQIAWFAYAAVLVGSFLAVDPFVEAPPVLDAALETLALSVLYLAVGIAILRHGLYDIDRIVNRTLVYAALTAVLLGTYLLVVAYLASLVQAQRDATWVSLAATGLVAVLFAPVRERLQLGVNRLMYGQQVDPYTVVSELGRRLESVPEPQEVLPTIARTIARALDLTQVEIWYAHDSALHLGAAHGEQPPHGQVGDAAELVGVRGITVVHPLTHRGEEVGALCAAQEEERPADPSGPSRRTRTGPRQHASAPRGLPGHRAPDHAGADCGPGAASCPRRSGHRRHPQPRARPVSRRARAARPRRCPDPALRPLHE
ncbi:hypothetical protein NF557_08780 [Ornithinimicrobium cryptoxanthini]|uniref:Histidine kinase N-terminal 7TM region domain-containing protein n=1 Tax=Ornithinimicrobium cryptoxanthini TaxID=2934161 RepID=A0ABY4YDE2_9MICO|nr:hypothetical protein [Ornithinimicrobium cryptoxanthini]USQ74770.1 hypothetical protein NF557_08780 [Ornithinimicrobium cryptoxanthini]